MDSQAIRTDTTRSLEEWQADPRVLLISRRGSTTLNLQDAHSDIDHLLVTEDTQEMREQENVLLDLNLITRTRFRKLARTAALEVVEAVYNQDYLQASYQGEMAAYQAYLESGREVEWLFWYQVWLMLKNQLKQYRKGTNDRKFASKIYLYHTLLQEEDLLAYWQHRREVSQEVREHYHFLRHHATTREDEELINQVEAYRGNNTLRAAYRTKSQHLLQRLEREGVLTF